jgi:hypothetical protein
VPEEEDICKTSRGSFFRVTPLTNGEQLLHNISGDFKFEKNLQKLLIISDLSEVPLLLLLYRSMPAHLSLVRQSITEVCT